jgi:hypothetical protein
MENLCFLPKLAEILFKARVSLNNFEFFAQIEAFVSKVESGATFRDEIHRWPAQPGWKIGSLNR